MEWVQQIFSRPLDDAAIERICTGLQTWLHSATRSVDGNGATGRQSHSITLPRFLGLPNDPEATRILLRDAYLRNAGDLLRTDLPPNKSLATALCKEVHQFAGHRWLCWVSMSLPPPNAGELDRLLFLAMQAGGGRLPTTSRQYATILKS